MTELTDSPVDDTTSGDPTQVHVFFLGASVPTGAQEVCIDKTGGVASRAVAVTLTADGDTQIEDDQFVLSTDAGTANPLCPTVSLSSNPSFVFVAASSGHGNNSDHDVNSGYTLVDEGDLLAATSLFYRRTTNTSSDVTDAGYTGGADNLSMICAAVSDV